MDVVVGSLVSGNVGLFFSGGCQDTINMYA